MGWFGPCIMRHQCYRCSLNNRGSEQTAALGPYKLVYYKVVSKYVHNEARCKKIGDWEVLNGRFFAVISLKQRLSQKYTSVLILPSRPGCDHC